VCDGSCVIVYVWGGECKYEKWGGGGGEGVREGGEGGWREGW